MKTFRFPVSEDIPELNDLDYDRDFYEEIELSIEKSKKGIGQYNVSWKIFLYGTMESKIVKKAVLYENELRKVLIANKQLRLKDPTPG